LFYPLETFFVHLNSSGLPSHETEKKAALGGDKKKAICRLQCTSGRQNRAQDKNNIIWFTLPLTRQRLTIGSVRFRKQ